MTPSHNVKFLKGEGGYLDDINSGDFLHLSILRSPYAHARIKSIDTSRALKIADAVYVGRDVNSTCGPLPVVWTAPGMRMLTQNALANDRVRFVGEPVACAISSDPFVAKDALELIDCQYDPLPAVVDADEAMKPGAPLLYDGCENNIGLHISRKYGDVDGSFKRAEVVIKELFKIGRVAPSAIEPRGVIANFDKTTGMLTLWSSTQIPYMLRHVLSQVLRLPENRIRVLSPSIGGGFGSKDSIYPEEVLTSYASMRVGRPVKWIEERRENLMVTNHDRDQIQYVEVAADRDGKVSALRVKILVNHGAFYRFHGARMLFLVLYMLSGQYKIPNLEAEAFSVLTNTMATFPYRGPGSTEAAFLIERVMDLVARRTGIDPAEVRRRNLILPDEFPYQTATGAVYDSGDYPESLRRALEIARYDDFRKEQEVRRRTGKYLGIGISCYQDETGMGPSKLLGSLGIRQPGWEKATVSIDQSGRVTVTSGIQSIGQGTEHSIAQIAASELEVPVDDVTVLIGDTQLGAFGGGAFGSRSLVVGGNAVHLAARRVREKILKVAAHMLEARLDDLVYQNGKVSVKGSAAASISLEEIASNSYIVLDLPPEIEPGLEATSAFDPPNFAFGYGTIVAKVEVDVETGIVKPISIVGVHDCGKVITDYLVEGQMHGGMVQGLGEAILEEVVYDKEGQLITGTFNDYGIPTSVDVPDIRLDSLVTPSPLNLLGVKGAGESGAIGVPAAFANATEDALLTFGITVNKLPVDPEFVCSSISRFRGVC
jgi:aerobic carbon-monoxide dehydrogenase large subunit